MPPAAVDPRCFACASVAHAAVARAPWCGRRFSLLVLLRQELFVKTMQRYRRLVWPVAKSWLPDSCTQAPKNYFTER